MRTAVVKVGGHVLFNGLELDVEYAKSLCAELRRALELYDGLVVVVGGGELARKYVAWGRALGLNESALDTIGLRVAAVNAALLWALFHGTSPPEVPSSVSEVVAAVPVWRVVFVGGFQPAQSTTTVAALVAEAVGAERLVLATDVDGVYEDDPKRNPKARKLEVATVDELERMFSGGVRAGEYRLLDPLTLAVIKRSRIETRVVSGKPPSNITRALMGEPVGTLIRP
jgi:uridylate kinase